MILRLAVFVLACACGVAYGGAPPPAQTAAMTRVVSDNPPFILYKPSAWTLRQSAVGETLSIAVASRGRAERRRGHLYRQPQATA